MSLIVSNAWKSAQEGFTTVNCRTMGTLAGMNTPRNSTGRISRRSYWDTAEKKNGGVIPDFQMNGYYRHDPMLRQISEAVRISGVAREHRINNKTEWNYINLPRVVVDNGESSWLRAENFKECRLLRHQAGVQQVQSSMGHFSFLFIITMCRAR